MKKIDTSLSRRHLLGAALTAPAWLQAGLAQAAGPAPAVDPADLARVTLRIGTYKGNWRALLVAAKLTDTPYKIEWRELNNGVLHIEALNGDALDLGSGSEIPALFAARQKAQVRFIAVVREDLNNQVTLARKDTAIRTIADLKGKRVGYVRATTAHYFLSKQLAEAGLSFSDIQAINLSPADGLSAFDRGDLDAWSIYGYNGQIARLKYGARVLKTGVGYLSGNFPVYANPKSISQPATQAAISDYLLRLRRAYLWANQNYLEYARVISEETRIPVGDLIELWNNRSTDFDLRAVSDSVVKGHQDVADTFQKLGVLDGPAQVAPLWDRSFDKLFKA
ncbi:MAG: ABC transporter substrate-binding protein [Curvibacter lanceolatus]|jgi:sulfonate transport system substrate-binding protein|uniref:ABC transporter substrate-binding protein n=1 Tax=Curvibacter lanceolatus TaxID=86182 RepID=UPI00037486EB|nr:ABC transporter substrate-binding protein [Curvibacter lanceolatus]MBV5295140.1 ABC transporter substrate-binding protein [Curvibacter lanceolatus]